MAEYKIITRKKMLKSRAFNIEKVDFLLPNGQQHTYDLVDHPDAVTILPINKQGEVYFVRQYRVGAEALLLELPAGVLDEGEEPEMAARRELREEIGMDCEHLEKIGEFFMSPGYSNEFMSVFFASALYPSPLAQDDDEFLELVKIPLAQVFKMLKSQQLVDGKTISSFLFALPILSEKFPEVKY